MSDQIISKEGYNKLKDELEQLSKIKRREIANRIEKAKELGDLGENAEYQEAKESQSFNEGRINEISNILKNVIVVDETRGGKNNIHMGSEITILNKKTKQEKVFKIVSFNEAEPGEGKISNESPLGLAFIGKKSGEEVTVKTPNGNIMYKVLKIN